MAVKKSVTLQDGNTAEYHKIRRIVDDARQVTVDIYKNKDARDAGKNSSKTNVYVVPEDVFTEDAFLPADKSPKRIAYTWLKTLGEFSGAEDI